MKLLKQLYVQVIIGVLAGIAVGYFWPAFATKLEPLGTAFVNAIKMIIGPVVFCTVAVGVARMSDIKAFGRVGVKALIYFELVSTLALFIGWGVGELVKPGVGADMAAATPADIAKAMSYAGQAHDYTIVGFLMKIIPTTFVSAFTEGNMLQVLFIAILTGFACARLGGFGDKAAQSIDSVAKVFFSVIHILVRAAPVGAFGAMAFTVGKYGLHALVKLGMLVGTFYLTSFLFVAVGLGLISWVFGRFNFFKFFRYIREEFFIVFGASSSEAALPQLMEKLQRLGAAKSVVGLVVPTGYSFNLDGTNIYMILATLFLAQATNTDLSFMQVLGIVAIAMLTSKGATGVTGAGFITLAATIAIVPQIPIVSLGLLVGIDRFMSECRALTNFLGNGVATLVVARWEGAIDEKVLKRELDAGPARAEKDEATEAHPV